MKKHLFIFKVYIIFWYLFFSNNCINGQTIYDFNKNETFNNWMIINDDVMGGVSNSNLSVDQNGNAVFFGNISLDYNGGFASIRHIFPKFNLLNKRTINLYLKGDGKVYQLRIKKNKNDYFSYVSSFPTSGKWEVITINLSDMYPSFRGRRLNYNNFAGFEIEELSILIGNKVEEQFLLIIDNIFVK